MANNKMIVEERSREVGNFHVGRLLPFRKKRQVGPFTFIDHMGPAELEHGRYIDVDQHPHIGLSTLTYLMEGSIEHRDSTGAVQVLGPGDVGFMTAGRGVTHTERTPAHFRDGNTLTMHGYQVWTALPVDMEDMEPRFDFVPKTALPKWQHGGLEMTLVAGKGFGKAAPLPVFSPLFMLDVFAQHAEELNIAGQLSGEIALVVTNGEIVAEETTIQAGQMLISKTDDECCIILKEGTRLLIFGGQALPEPRYLYWNFVSSSKEKLERAKRDWEARRFPKVPGDNSYIPLPNF